MMTGMRKIWSVLAAQGSYSNGGEKTLVRSKRAGLMARTNGVLHEDHTSWTEGSRFAIADRNLDCTRQHKDKLSPRSGVPVTCVARLES
jgi:hypothetical protein